MLLLPLPYSARSLRVILALSVPGGYLANAEDLFPNSTITQYGRIGHNGDIGDRAKQGLVVQLVRTRCTVFSDRDPPLFTHIVTRR
jgi:hypothetical protein